MDAIFWDNAGMSRIRPLQTHIPTNIITGFLGAGKTTAIRRWLASKPESEKWAVLVNEFGQVGIDGALFANDGIAVKEVPGGCMCCATGLPTKVALNQLIRQHRPDRILIEPTGLAHPRQILQLFSGPEYQTLLDLQAVICLLDPASINDPRYARAILSDQIQLADILVASKIDSASPNQLMAFEDIYHTRLEQKSTLRKSLGPMNWEWLQLPHHTTSTNTESPTGHSRLSPAAQPALPQTASATALDEPLIEPKRYQQQSPYGYSCGWRFPPHWQFDETAFNAWFDNLSLARVKGVIHTSSGWRLINCTPKSRSIESISSAPAVRSDSRLEIIHTESVDWSAIESALFACIKKTSQSN